MPNVACVTALCQGVSATTAIELFAKIVDRLIRQYDAAARLPVFLR